MKLVGVWKSVILGSGRPRGLRRPFQNGGGLRPLAFGRVFLGPPGPPRPPERPMPDPSFFFIIFIAVHSAATFAVQPREDLCGPQGPFGRRRSEPRP